MTRRCNPDTMAAMSLIGDRERDRAALELRRHYLRGRLSVEELDRRVSLAVAARSSRDLGRALRDLPAPWRDAAFRAKIFREIPKKL